MSNGAISLFFAKSTDFAPGHVLVWNTANADQVYEAYKASGAQIVEDMKTRSWGMREFELTDPQGYLLRFGQHDPRAGEPLTVGREIESEHGATMSRNASKPHPGSSVPDAQYAVIPSGDQTLTVLTERDGSDRRIVLQGRSRVAADDQGRLPFRSGWTRRILRIVFHAFAAHLPRKNSS